MWHVSLACAASLCKTEQALLGGLFWPVEYAAPGAFLVSAQVWRLAESRTKQRRAACGNERGVWCATVVAAWPALANSQLDVAWKSVWTLSALLLTRHSLRGCLCLTGHHAFTVLAQARRDLVWLPSKDTQHKAITSDAKLTDDLRFSCCYIKVWLVHETLMSRLDSQEPMGVPLFSRELARITISDGCALHHVPTCALCN